MNLSALDTVAASNQGATLELRTTAGAPLLTSDNKPVTITLLGKDSDVYIKAENAVTNRRLAAAGRVKLTAEALRADSISTLAKCTVSWSGVGIDEEETACSTEAAVQLYTRYPFIKEQVDEFINERANFLQS